MSTVKKISNRHFEVSGFLEFLPNVTCEVIITEHEARVINRTGTTRISWDQHAICAVLQTFPEASVH